MKASIIIAAAACQVVTAVQPVVRLDYSTYQGKPLDNGVTQWLGMRYAAPPVGDLRWRAPRDPESTQELQDATKHGHYCIGTGQNVTESRGEDCLFVDVYAPSKATSCHPLPVFVWIMGGGFNQNSKPNSNGTGLVKASDEEIVVVNFNYRVGNYGFMTNGDPKSSEIDTNMGLLDQRKLFAWVQKYISHFGGDPRRVVIGGASAGGASVTYQLTAYDGEDSGLFVGAAAESQSFGTVLTAEAARYQFVNLAKQVGCWDTEICHADDDDGEDMSNDAEVLSCMRTVPTSVMQAAAIDIPYPNSNATEAPLYMWSPVIDGKLVRDLTYKRFMEGKYVKVPTIFGDDTNGGTSFAPEDATTIQDTNAFLTQQYPTITEAQLTRLEQLYPNSNQSACPAEGCFWRQASDVYGDIRYMCPSLFLGETLSENGQSPPPVYIYRYDVLDPAQNASGQGVPHTVEVAAIWGPENLNRDAPESYLPGGINEPAISMMQGYWTSFVRSLDPSKFRKEGTVEWPAWQGGMDQGKRILFGTGGVTSVEGITEVQREKCAYAESIALELLQ